MSHLPRKRHRVRSAEKSPDILPEDLCRIMLFKFARSGNLTDLECLRQVLLNKRRDLTGPTSSSSECSVHDFRTLRDRKQRSLLHVAAKAGHIEVVNFLMDDIAIVALRDSETLKVVLLPYWKAVRSGCTNNVGLLSPYAEDMQTIPNRLRVVADLFGFLQFVPSKCDVLLQDWIGTDYVFVVVVKALETVDPFTHLGGVISSACNIADEAFTRIA
ncbi:uncharacterized protein DEA37_0008828 [Paragonimus westermani]|uniref:Uncharacterized protein n=1 Tax=Paragonimus westermani TaxID=34504 RepID=A0A5J4NEN5_9TREM|nr:uncharacterized protein DEA37_0008828 [Paragonimus westermani]